MLQHTMQTHRVQRKHIAVSCSQEAAMIAAELWLALDKPEICTRDGMLARLQRGGVQIG